MRSISDCVEGDFALVWVCMANMFAEAGLCLLCVRERSTALATVSRSWSGRMLAMGAMLGGKFLKNRYRIFVEFLSSFGSILLM